MYGFNASFTVDKCFQWLRPIFFTLSLRSRELSQRICTNSKKKKKRYRLQKHLDLLLMKGTLAIASISRAARLLGIFFIQSRGACEDEKDKYAVRSKPQNIELCLSALKHIYSLCLCWFLCMLGNISKMRRVKKTE